MSCTLRKIECEVSPLKTVDEIISWTPPECNIKLQKLIKRATVQENSPRTLVCHDMQGGYLEDRWIHGVQDDKAYRFYHWYFIDTMVYFSHYLVTIPPISWTNAGHRNGVPVLGTFITEWDDGFSGCEKLLSSTDFIINVAQKLTAIAQYYGFDGWLLNIENKLKPENIPKMVKFARLLTKLMHLTNPLSMVIWYDSIICSGELKWQNELNVFNKCFFDACDGFFVNYTWTEENLKNTVKMAGERLRDVYVGIDVFGRNCYGGGGFNTKAALEIVRNYKLSAAIFAQGWVYECLGADHFSSNECKFWEPLIKMCNKAKFTELPFVTNFCQGFGEKFFHSGRVLCDKPWHDMSLQQIQPMHSCDAPSHCYMSASTKDAYMGGGCLELSGKLAAGIKSAYFTLFLTSFNVFTGKCLTTLAYKKHSSHDVKVKAVLKVKDHHNQLTICLLNENTKNNDIISELQEIHCNITHGEATTLINEEKAWITDSFHVYHINENQFEIQEIGISIETTSAEADQTFAVLLGHFSIELDYQNTQLKSLVCTLINKRVENEIKCVRASYLLEWESSVDVDFWCVGWSYKKETEMYHLGTTSQSFFHVNDLELTESQLLQQNSLYFTVKGHVYGSKNNCCKTTGFIGFPQT